MTWDFLTFVVDLFLGEKGQTTYDNGGVKVTVTTTAISHEEECLTEKLPAAAPKFVAGSEKKHNNLPVSKKKPFKKIAKKRSRPKPQNKRDRKKGKKKNKKQ